MWRDGPMLQRLPHHPSRPFRVVVETDDPALAVSDFVSFAAAGFDVVCCGGPGDNDPCPAVEGRSCPLVEDSDVVLNQLNDRGTQHAVVDGVHRTSPDVPMVVTVPAGFRLRPAGRVRPSGTGNVSQRADAGSPTSCRSEALARPRLRQRRGRRAFVRRCPGVLDPHVQRSGMRSSHGDEAPCSAPAAHEPGGSGTSLMHRHPP